MRGFDFDCIAVRQLGVNGINKNFLLASIALAVICFAGFAQATGLTPYFNATTSTATTTMYGVIVYWETYNSTDNAALQTNYTVYYKLSTATGYTTLCSSATEASGLKNCSVGFLNRAKVYNCNVTACNGTSCNTSVSMFTTTSYDNVNLTTTVASSIILNLQGTTQFIAHTIDSMLDTSSGMVDLIVIAVVLVILAYAMYWAVKARRNLK